MAGLDGFIKQYPNTYALYNSTRKLLDPYTNEDIMEALRIEYITTDCGEYFSELLLCAEEQHFLDKFTPDEMFIMFFWISVCSSNAYGDLELDIKRLSNEYYKITGNKVPDYDHIPKGTL